MFPDSRAEKEYAKCMNAFQRAATESGDIVAQIYRLFYYSSMPQCCSSLDATITTTIEDTHFNLWRMIGSWPHVEDAPSEEVYLSNDASHHDEHDAAPIHVSSACDNRQRITFISSLSRFLSFFLSIFTLFINSISLI